MYKIAAVLLCLGLYFCTSNAVKAPFIKPCKVENSKLSSDCLVESGQAALPHIVKGLPDLGIPSSDPMHIEDVKVDHGGLQLSFKNMMVVGAKKCKLTKLDHTANSYDFHLELECPVVTTGKYKATGKVLGVNAEGDGDFEIKTDNIRCIVDLSMKEVDGLDGKKYWQIGNFTTGYETMEKFHFDMKNLFNGDKEKAKSLMDVLNHSWKLVIDTFGDPMIHEIIEMYIDIIKKLFEVVPASELRVV